MMILIRYFPVLFVSGEALREYYFPVFAPLGIIGNLLSLLVNISSHRKKMYFNFIECSWAVENIDFVESIWMRKLSQLLLQCSERQSKRYISRNSLKFYKLKQFNRCLFVVSHDAFLLFPRVMQQNTDTIQDQFSFSDFNSFFNKHFGEQKSFWWGHWYPCSGLLVTFIWVGSLIHAWQKCMCCYVCYVCAWDSPLVQHLLTSWWPAWQLSHFLPCTCEQTLVGFETGIVPRLTVWFQQFKAWGILCSEWQVCTFIKWKIWSSMSNNSEIWNL